MQGQGVEVGGTGWDLKKRLPPEIENMKPDDTLYGIDYGMGFTSRGCIRNCKFCVVPVMQIKEYTNDGIGQKIKTKT